MRQSLHTATRLIRIERELLEQSQRIKDVEALLRAKLGGSSVVDMTEADIKHLYPGFHI